MGEERGGRDTYWTDDSYVGFWGEILPGQAARDGNYSTHMLHKYLYYIIYVLLAKAVWR